MTERILKSGDEISGEELKNLGYEFLTPFAHGIVVIKGNNHLVLEQAENLILYEINTRIRYRVSTVYTRKK